VPEEETHMGLSVGDDADDDDDDAAVVADVDDDGSTDEHLYLSTELEVPMEMSFALDGFSEEITLSRGVPLCKVLILSTTVFLKRGHAQHCIDKYIQLFYYLISAIK
jgi:hypothetical protein